MGFTLPQMDQTKVCTKCELVLDLGGFAREARGRFGRRSICKKCDCLRAKRRQVSDGGKIRAAQRARWSANRDEQQVKRIARMFSLPVSVAETLCSSGCNICNADPGVHAHRHAVDHDHGVSGAASVRGVLCARCNCALGYFESGQVRKGITDDPQWASAATAYLQRYASRIRATALSHA